MTKKKAILTILVLLAVLSHWYFGTKVFTLYSYPVFNKRYWYAEILKTWIQSEDKTRLRVWKDTIPVFMNESGIELPNLAGFTVISLNPKSALWNEYRNRRFCQIIEEKVHHNLKGREIKLRIRDNYNEDTSAFNITRLRISVPRDLDYILFGMRYKWFIAREAGPTRTHL